jgi:hypothetical protein
LDVPGEKRYGQEAKIHTRVINERGAPELKTRCWVVYPS